MRFFRGDRPESDPDSVFWFHAYHPWRGGNNPEFGPESARILDLKRGMSRAVSTYVRWLSATVEDGVAICVVPSHAPRSRDGGIQRVARTIAGNGRTDATGCLVRVRPVAKLAHGGDRSIATHLGSIEVRNARLFEGKPILLLDDVFTTGNSLAACRQLLLQHGATEVQRLALSRTE